MSADALAPGVTKASPAMWFTIKNVRRVQLDKTLFFNIQE